MGYNNVIATGSLSKAWSLAGIRLGWIISPNLETVRWCESVRFFTNLTVSQIDDQVATFAFDPTTRLALMARNIQLARDNIQIMEDLGVLIGHMD